MFPMFPSPYVTQKCFPVPLLPIYNMCMFVCVCIRRFVCVNDNVLALYIRTAYLCHINTHHKEYLAHRCRRSTNVQLCLIFLYIPISLSLYGWHAIFCITNDRHDVTITTHAIKCHFLIWMTTMRQRTKRWCSCVSTLKCTFICVYWWTRQRIHNTWGTHGG